MTLEYRWVRYNWGSDWMPAAVGSSDKRVLLLGAGETEPGERFDIGPVIEPPKPGVSHE